MQFSFTGIKRDGENTAFSVIRKTDDRIGLFKWCLFRCEVLIEFIAYASYTDDEFRIVWIFFDLFSQCADIYHNSFCIVFHAVGLPYSFEYLRCRENLSRVFDKQLQDIELFRCEIDFFAVGEEPLMSVF